MCWQEMFFLVQTVLVASLTTDDFFEATMYYATLLLASCISSWPQSFSRMMHHGTKRVSFQDCGGLEISVHINLFLPVYQVLNTQGIILS